jgi:hypothetical protein
METVNGPARRVSTTGKGWTQTDRVVHLEMNRGHISDIERGQARGWNYYLAGIAGLPGSGHDETLLSY